MIRRTERVTCYHCSKSFVRVTPPESTPECNACRKALYAEIIRFIGPRWRYESTIANRMLTWKDTLWVARVEDALFELVQQGKLEWFGTEQAAYCRPDRRPTKYEGVLKYRLKEKNGNT
jgi:hypothetical protein